MERQNTRLRKVSKLFSGGGGTWGAQGTSELKSIADETLTARTQMKMLSATVEDMRGWMGQMMDDTVSKVDHNMNAVVHEMQVSVGLSVQSEPSPGLALWSPSHLSVCV